jgi:hypothetical protein
MPSHIFPVNAVSEGCTKQRSREASANKITFCPILHKGADYTLGNLARSQKGSGWWWVSLISTASPALLSKNLNAYRYTSYQAVDRK